MLLAECHITLCGATGAKVFGVVEYLASASLALRLASGPMRTRRAGTGTRWRHQVGAAGAVQPRDVVGHDLWTAASIAITRPGVVR